MTDLHFILQVMGLTGIEQFQDPQLTPATLPILNIGNHCDYATAWLSRSAVLLLENDSVIWLDNDGWGDDTMKHLDEIKKDTTWVEAENIFRAATDDNGNPVEMLPDRINQVWYIYGMKKE